MSSRRSGRVAVAAVQDEGHRPRRRSAWPQAESPDHLPLLLVLPSNRSRVVFAVEVRDLHIEAVEHRNVCWVIERVLEGVVQHLNNAWGHALRPGDTVGRDGND